MVFSKLSHLFPRTKNLIENIVKSALYKGLSICLSYLIIPISLQYLGNEKYGIWVTLMTIINWFTISDIGLGNGLRNKLTEALAFKNYTKASELVSTAYFIISLIALTIYLLAYSSTYIFNWTKFLNIKEIYQNEIVQFLRITFLLFSFQLILNLIVQISNAYQKPAYNSLANLLINSLVYGALYLLIRFDDSSSLIYTGLIISGSPVLIYSLFSVFLFNTKFRNINFSFTSIKRQHFHDLFTLGVFFFIGQITYIVNYSISNVLISSYLGSSSVTVYNIVFKYFSIVTMGYSIIITPFWSSFTEAYSLKDFVWIKKTIKLLNKITLLIAFLVILMIIFAKPVFRLWIGESFYAPFNLIIMMGLYVISLTFITPYIYFLNGVNKAKDVTVLSILSCIINLIVVIILFKFTSLGVLSAVIGPIVSNLLFASTTLRKYRKLIENEIYY